jgi:hypothetical protein
MLMWIFSLQCWRPCDSILVAWRMPYTIEGELDILEGIVDPFMALDCLDACMEAWS